MSPTIKKLVHEESSAAVVELMEGTQEPTRWGNIISRRMFKLLKRVAEPRPAPEPERTRKPHHD